MELAEREVIAVKMTTVKGVMTDSVVAVREDADFKAMVTVMRSRRISAFPVIDASSRVVGVVSEADPDRPLRQRRDGLLVQQC